MEEKATEKQIKFMKQLGIPYIDGIYKSAARVAIQDKLNEENGDPKPKDTGAPFYEKIEPEVVKLKLREPKDNGFHLTEESINLGALQCALGWYGDFTPDDEGEFWKRVAKFKKYIVTGE